MTNSRNFFCSNFGIFLGGNSRLYIFFFWLEFQAFINGFCFGGFFWGFFIFFSGAAACRLLGGVFGMVFGWNLGIFGSHLCCFLLLLSLSFGLRDPPRSSRPPRWPACRAAQQTALWPGKKNPKTTRIHPKNPPETPPASHGVTPKKTPENSPQNGAKLT